MAARDTRAAANWNPRIALFMGIADDAEGRRRAAAFRQGLQQLGWKEGTNVRVDERWGVADTEVIRASAIELLQLNPSVIVVQGARAVPILQQTTKSIPIVTVKDRHPSRVFPVLRFSAVRNAGCFLFHPSLSPAKPAFWRPLGGCPPIPIEIIAVFAWNAVNLRIAHRFPVAAATDLGVDWRRETRARNGS